MELAIKPLPFTLRKISTKKVIANMFDELKVNKNIDDFLHIFNSKPKLDKEIFELAKKLKKYYKTALLSDNFDDMTNTIRKNLDFKKYFDLAIFSNEVGLVKREDKIYRFAVKNLRCKPSECVLIDDKKENIQRARRLGINGILFESIKKVKIDLRKLNVKF